MSNLKNVEPLQDFNWDEFENGTSASVSKDVLEKAYDETLNKVSEHQVTEGTVISVDKKEVIVNIGYKSDGIIPASEFRYNPDLKVGDKVEVYVENQEDKKGQLVLSHKKARLSKSWERVNAALDNEEGQVFARGDEMMWVCSNCGHIHVGPKAPEVCPVCEHPKAYFMMRVQNY